MKITVTNMYSEQKQTFEGTEQQIEEHLALNYPAVATEVEPDDLAAFLDALNDSQTYSVEVIDAPDKYAEVHPSALQEYFDPWAREGDQPDRDKHHLVDTPAALGQENK